METDQITHEIIACAFTIHKALGPGLLESAFHACMFKEMTRRQLHVESQVTLPLIYNGVYAKKGYRVDLLVERKVVVEIKAAKAVTDVDIAQVKTYLKLLKLGVGLILNFQVRWMQNGIYRILNPDASA